MWNQWTSCWQLEIDRSGNIYSTEVGKCHKSRCSPPPESQLLSIFQHTSGLQRSSLVLMYSFIHSTNMDWVPPLKNSLNSLSHLLSQPWLMGYSVPMLCVLNHFSHVRLCNPMDCSLPGSSVRGVLQARILEWAAMSSSRGSSQPKDWTCVS